MMLLYHRSHLQFKMGLQKIIAQARQAVAAYTPPVVAPSPSLPNTGDQIGLSFANAARGGGATHTAQGDIPFVNPDGKARKCFGCFKDFPIGNNHTWRNCALSGCRRS